jgi:apolipoprotein N-acyltransferase
MDDDLPSSTPEKGGDNKATANKPSDEGDGLPNTEPKPRQRKSRKWFGLSKSQWREFGGFLILIPWLWYDLIDSHNFLKLLLLAISLVVAQALACSFITNRFKARIIWFASLIPVAVVVWINSRPLADSRSYELLPQALASNIVKTLSTSCSSTNPTGILIHLVNPDVSAYALSEQLKKMFRDGGCVIVEGQPPANIPEVPGVSCFLYGNASTNAGLYRALSMIVSATKSPSEFEITPSKYPNELHIISNETQTPWDSTHPPTLPEMIDVAKRLSVQPLPNGIAVFIIRAK